MNSVKSLTVARVNLETERAMREIREECASKHVPTPIGFDWIGRIMRRIESWVLIERSGFSDSEEAIWNSLTARERREIIGMTRDWQDVR